MYRVIYKIMSDDGGTYLRMTFNNILSMANILTKDCT